MSDSEDKNSDIETKIKEYIDNRLLGKQSGYLGYYDRAAGRMKKRHIQSRSVAAIGAVLIPVVSNIAWVPEISGTRVEIATIGASLIGVTVALILALEGVFHFKEQWQNFRGTEQYLLSQKYRFENSADEYQSLSREDAFKLFVSRVEKAILDENNVTLNILGRTEGTTSGNTLPTPSGNPPQRVLQSTTPVVPHVAQ